MLQQEEIKEAMQRKVSRERIGIEVRKMLSGQNPARAFQLLSEFDLLDIVFNDPSSPQSPSRDWTKEVATTAHDCLEYLQQSRLTTANHQISFVEASGAAATALFLPSVPHLDAASLQSTSIETIAGQVDEEVLIACAVQYVIDREAISWGLPQDDMVEMLKLNVKWPKPAAKRVALIVEAVATFPVADVTAENANADHELIIKRFMWMTRYNSVLAPAVAILLSRSAIAPTDRDAGHRALLDLGAHYAKLDADSSSAAVKRRRIDGRVVKERLGQSPGPQIARALSVLHVWEALHPSGSVDDELAFLERLAARLQ